MDLPLLLISLGIILSIISIFIGQKSKISADDIEKISISLHQETNGLKKRIRALEEELMLSMEPIRENIPQSPKPAPVHEIIVNQILSLHAQGYAIREIAKRSSLESEQVIEVLRSRGVV